MTFGPIAASRLSRRTLLAVAGLTVLPAHAQFAPAPPIAPFGGFEGSTVRFAGVVEGRQVLGTDDDWIQATSDFQRGTLMDTAPPVSREAFLGFNRSVVVAWKPAEVQRWRKTLARLAPRFNELKLQLPKEVLLVTTNGRESSESPYTRGSAVVLPGEQPVDEENTNSDLELLAHEMFHVVSRHDRGLADRLYATIGFQPCEPLQWPAAWLPIRIANPDATSSRHFMRAQVADHDADLIPLIVARRTGIDRSKNENLFSVLDVRLLEVIPGKPGQPTLPVMRNGEPVWNIPAGVGPYLDRLGGNTGYIIHPEETMADNIAYLVSRRTVRNPDLLRKIESVLTGKPLS